METKRDLHPDFQALLHHKEAELIELFVSLRNYILTQYPDCNELLYHTHALTAVYSVSEKLSDAFCMLPIYTNHMNLGFNKGTLLKDPSQLLSGTGKLIRHVAIEQISDCKKASVLALIKAAHELAIEDLSKPSKTKGKTISKIKKS